MKIGIDLLWVRPGKCGGTESYIRNLVDGLAAYDAKNHYVLFVAEDNKDSFAKYGEQPSMELCVCPVICSVQAKRMIWENLKLDGLAKAHRVDVMFIPVYSKPRTWGSKIPYVTVIHDLQALHYPQYFSRVRRLFLKYMWRYACRTSQKLVTISRYCHKDLLAHYPSVGDKCSVIYNPVETAASGISPSYIEEKYAIESGSYFYCVSSMLPHKNLMTLLRAMKLRKEAGETMPLVLSGVGGDKAEFDAAVTGLGLGDVVIDTGFVTDKERDCLYENCRLFLFPSVFEGFGMPPIEALRRGKVTVMTRESCLEEVTEGKAVYVDAPYDEADWDRRIRQAMELPERRYDFPEYTLRRAVEAYLGIFAEFQEI